MSSILLRLRSPLRPAWLALACLVAATQGSACANAVTDALEGLQEPDVGRGGREPRDPDRPLPPLPDDDAGQGGPGTDGGGGMDPTPPDADAGASPEQDGLSPPADVEVPPPGADAGDPVDVDLEEDADAGTPPIGGGCPFPPVCSLAQTRCEANQVQTCRQDAEGCPAWQTTRDCATAGPDGFCQPTPVPATCVVPPDRCAGLANPCGEAGTRCDGSTLRTCAPNGDGCLVEFSTNCLAAEQLCGGTPAACRAPECGDGKVEGPLETCDDGNTTPGDGCSATCRVETGFSCAGEPSVCQVALCGNGRVDAGEECDDGNTRSGDGCTAECLREGQLSCPRVAATLSCPGGSLRTNNGNGRNDFTGYSVCASGSYGANELVWEFRGQGGQTARAIMLGDAANRNVDLFVLRARSTPPACNTNMDCTSFSNTSGTDGFVSWRLDTSGVYALVVDGRTPGAFAPLNQTDFTLFWECATEVCGDGLLTGSETCDDGNTTAGDGCSATCRVETGWACGQGAGTCFRIPCADNDRPGERCPAVLPMRNEMRVTVQGALTATDPRFARPTESCRTDSGSNFPWDAYVIENLDTLPMIVDVTANWTGDGFLAAYDTFDPAAPLAGCLGGNDDLDSITTSGFLLRLAPGARFTLVATSFRAANIGNYSLTLRSLR
jgi:cysteine-rich repeat protein